MVVELAKIPYIKYLLGTTIIAGILLWIGFRNYLLFHVLVELFSVVIALSVFLLMWNARKLITNKVFIILGICFLCVGTLDLIHLITYKGMNIISGVSANIPTQLWLLSRYLLTLTFLSAPFLIRKKISLPLVFTIIVTVSAIGCYAILYTSVLPRAFIENQGLTSFKIISEYVIIFGLLLSLYAFHKKRDQFDGDVYRLLVSSILVSIVTEYLFTLYKTPFDISNMLGHILKTAAYYLMYKSIIELGLRRPYQVLYRELAVANNRKEEFITMAGHELKTPLTSIKLYLQLLERSITNSQPRESNLIKKSLYQLRRTENLMQDLLDIAKIETGKIPYRMKALKIDTVIEKLVKSIAAANPDHTISVLATSKAEITGDRDRIEQAVSNLVYNAIKYSPKKSTILVSTNRVNDQVIITVTDSGKGISKRDQTKIFDKYYRTKTSEKVEGVGFGLFITKQIVEAHQGTIKVNSKVGKGSKFSLLLPTTHS